MKTSIASDHCSDRLPGNHHGTIDLPVNHRTLHFSIFLTGFAGHAITNAYKIVCAPVGCVSSQGNFNGDLKRMGGILADCVSQVKGIQAESSESSSVLIDFWGLH